MSSQTERGFVITVLCTIQIFYIITYLKEQGVVTGGLLFYKIQAKYKLESRYKLGELSKAEKSKKLKYHSLGHTQVDEVEIVTAELIVDKA